MASSTGIRKVWVRRPGASPTMVAFHENDLVDDVRDTVLRKYGNSLGRTYDAPDITLRLVPRESHHNERLLGPDEPIGRVLDIYYPGGQTMDEAIVIDLPLRRSTPGASPRGGGSRGGPDGYGSDYFGPGAVAVASASSSSHHYGHHNSHHPHIHLHSSNVGSVPGNNPNNLLSAASAVSPNSGVPAGMHHHHPHSISVLSTGQVPPLPNLPSPGGGRRLPRDRPKLNRQHSDVPQDHNGYVSSGAGNSSSKPKISMPSMDGGSVNKNRSPGGDQHVGTIAQVTSQSRAAPRSQSPFRGKKQKRVSKVFDDGTSPALLGPLSVPPINVLIVEDNIINLKLLEAFVKRLKVRWSTAMNGRDAVRKWREGGFHLVLMDIQLPLMSGLDATREIRRLERVNSIGVFASTPSDSVGNGRGPESDKLDNISLFKSPVIIVALTASSLQSDRNDALAAGCNDFLTKPVNFVWLEKKITEWGCMQALIDFDGWRNWKELTEKAAAERAAKERQERAAADALGKKKKSGHSKKPSLSGNKNETGESSDTVMPMSSSSDRSGMGIVPPSRGALDMTSRRNPYYTFPDRANGNSMVRAE